MAIHILRIDDDGKPGNDYLAVRNGDHVLFDGPRSFKVKFADSPFEPFEQKTFGEDNPLTGPFVHMGSAKEGKDYPYTVAVPGRPDSGGSTGDGKH